MATAETRLKTGHSHFVLSEPVQELYGRTPPETTEKPAFCEALSDTIRKAVIPTELEALGGITALQKAPGAPTASLSSPAPDLKAETLDRLAKKIAKMQAEQLRPRSYGDQPPCQRSTRSHGRPIKVG